MTFNPNIPQGNQTISSTTNGIQTNFSQSNTAFAVDHTAFNVLTNQGMHKQVTLLAPVAASGAGTQGIIHTNNGAGITFSGVPIPFFSNSLGDFPMIPDLINNSNDYSFKIGNLIFNIGNGTNPGPGSSVAVSYKTTFPTKYISLTVSSNSPGAAATASLTTTSGFTMNVPPTSKFSYIAIGY